MNPRGIPRWISNIALSAAVMAAAFIVAEIVLRITYHPENLGTVIRHDKTLGWSLNPHSYLHSVDHGRGLDYSIRINSAGMRDREITVGKPGGKKRILILGDSIAFGTGVEVGERFSDILGEFLGGNMEIMNCAVCGWGNDQELLYFETFARHLEPDVVVLTLTLNNDILNNVLDHLYLETAPKPLFSLVGDSLFLDNNHVVPPKIPYGIKIRNILRKSRLLLFIKRRINMRRYMRAAESSMHSFPRGFGGRYMDEDCSYWSVYKKSYGTRLEKAWMLMEAILSRFVSRCRDEGAEPVIFAFPLKVEVDEAWRNKLFERTGIDSTQLDFKNPYDRLALFCAGENVDFVYPLETFQKTSHERSLYFDRDSHPNRNGHALAADVLYEVLKRRI